MSGVGKVDCQLYPPNYAHHSLPALEILLSDGGGAISSETQQPQQEGRNHSQVLHHIEKKVKLQLNAIAPDVSLLSLVDVAPKQLDQIIKLKEIYYVAFNQIVAYYRAIPFLVWTLESLGKLLVHSQKYPETPNTKSQSKIKRYWSERVMQAVDRSFEKVYRDFGLEINKGAAAVPTTTHRCLKEEARIGKGDKWLSAVNAMDALLGIQFEDEFHNKHAQDAMRLTECAQRGAHEMWKKQVNMSDPANAFERQRFLSMLPHQAYSQLSELTYSILKPSEEWQLLALTDVTPKKNKKKETAASTLTSMGGGHKKSSSTPEDKNQFQMSEQALTLSGLRKIVDNAEHELTKLMSTSEDLYVCVMQSLHAIGSLVENERINEGYLDMATVITERAAPFIHQQ